MGVSVVFKSIKPKRLKVDEYRKQILNALRAEGAFQKKELEKTVRTWKHKPNFEFLIGLTYEDAMVVTGPTGDTFAVQLWEWTDQGTKPHTIRAKRAPALRFQTGFQAKTVRGSFRSRRSRRFGPWVRPKQVKHPGTRARLWSETLTKRRKRPFMRRMISAMQSAAKKSF